MTDRYQLNETRSPIDTSSWRDLNENWDLIKSYLRFLERQITVLAGGKEIADLIDSITSAITNVEKVISDSESAEEAVLEAVINLETTIENFAPKGTWSSTASYKKGNQVEVSGTTYIALVDNVNTPVTNTSTWRKFAERGLQGVQGPQGIQGPKGDKGDTGPQGIQGVQGPQGEIGPRGVQGTQGPKGDKGDKGEMGTGINILGEFSSSTQLPSSGSIGDAYLINGNIFVWAGSSWTDGGNIKGPKGDKGDKGDQGIQGVQGPQGLKGDTGSQGLKGADGKTWHVTASTPANSLGVVGDMHLNTATFDIREKTGTSTWTLRGNIKGIKGDKGDAGSDANVTSDNITNALGYTPANNNNLTSLQQQVTTHLDETERNYNLANYMRNSKTAVQAFQQILTEIGTNGTRTTIYVPTGYYDFTEITSSFSLPPQLTIRGDGNNSSILLVKSKELFSIGNQESFVNSILFKDINFMSLTVPDSDQVCVGVRNGGDIVFDHVQFSNVATILIGGNGNLPCHSIRFINLKGYLHNLGRPAFELYNGTGLFLDGALFVNGTNTPIHGEVMNTVVGTDLISLQGNWDTLEVKGIYERFYRVLYGVTNGKIIQNITLEGVFDYIRQSCIDMKTNNTAGAITGVKIVDSWIFCWEGDAIRIINTSDAIVRNISVSNCDIACAGMFGIHMLKIKSFLISNNRISGIGQVDGNNNGIFITEANSDFVIEGNVLTYAPNTGINWGSSPWIYVSGESDNYNITNNHAYGYLIMQPTNPNSNRLVTTNTRWGNELDLMYDKNYSFPLPDDNVNFNNPFSFILDIYVFGSITSVHKNNIQIAGVSESANINIKLYPGESLKIKRNGTVNWTIFGLT